MQNYPNILEIRISLVDGTERAYVQPDSKEVMKITPLRCAAG